METPAMTVTKAQEKAKDKQPARQQQQQQGSGSASLHDRYGKIGISAVAGACQHKGEKRTKNETRFTERDSD
jgi:hypothetical protein